MVDDHDVGADARTVDLDDALRLMLTTELRRIGVPASGLPSLFASLQVPLIPSGKPWSWLRSVEARTEVGCLVLLVDPALVSPGTGAAYLSSFAHARLWLGQPGAVVVDVSSFIRELEDQTGCRYDG